MVPKTSFPHTNPGILIFRICENAVPSLYVARRPVTGCVTGCVLENISSSLEVGERSF